MERLRWVAALAAILVVAVAIEAQANPASDALRSRGSEELYNLDEQALATWRQATAADPQDAAAWRGLASAIVLRIGMLRGTMTVDSYLGRVATKDVQLTPAPPELSKEFANAVSRGIALARQKVAARPNDPEPHYELGAALGLRASYLASVDGSMVGAFRAAREAYDEHEKVLALDQTRTDAALTVGTYRYLIASMSMPMRWVAYMAGFGGGRERGLRMVESAAASPGDTQTEARIALLLLYNREERYDDALAQLEKLRQRYPRNRLFWLETGSTLLRAKRPAEAERFLNDGIAMTARDPRPRMFGEDALWFYRRGAARAALGRTAEARDDLNRALASSGRKWVEGRAHLELGRIALNESNTSAAREHLELAVTLGDSDQDGASADRARALLKQRTAAR